LTREEEGGDRAAEEGKQQPEPEDRDRDRERARDRQTDRQTETEREISERETDRQKKRSFSGTREEGGDGAAEEGKQQPEPEGFRRFGFRFSGSIYDGTVVVKLQDLRFDH